MNIIHVITAELTADEKEAFRTIAHIDCKGVPCEKCPLKIVVNNDRTCIRHLIMDTYNFINKVNDAIGGRRNDY